MPFSGWQLPGVMTMGAAQMPLETSRQTPRGRVWIAGQGPLLQLYVRQLIAVGGRIAGVLDMSSPRRLRGALPGLMRAPAGWGRAAQGLNWMLRLHWSGIAHVGRGRGVVATGEGRLTSIEWTDPSGQRRGAPADVLLIHDSLLPSNQIGLALGCRSSWDERQQCHILQTDDENRISRPALFAAGDCTRIGGVEIARLEGRIAGIGAVRLLAPERSYGTERIVRKLRTAIRRQRAFRDFLDICYPAGACLDELADDVIVCRCEGLAAGDIRQTAAQSRGSNQLKSMSRMGMGACQGRQCASTLDALLMENAGRCRAKIRPATVRPPFRPVTLGEIANIEYRPPEVRRM